MKTYAVFYMRACFILLMTSSSLHAASYISRAANALSSAVYVGCSFLPVYVIALRKKQAKLIENHFTDDVLERIEKCYPLTATFIKKELQGLGLEHVRFIPSIDKSHARVLWNDIAINCEILEHVEKCLVRIKEAKEKDELPEKMTLVLFLYSKVFCTMRLDTY